MLVLKRKIGETVMIGDEIEVRVLGVEGEYVKIGFSAPKNIQIMRKELHVSIAEENTAAGLPQLSKNDMERVLKQYKK